jgi:hypothetical protein
VLPGEPEKAVSSRVVNAGIPKTSHIMQSMSFPSRGYRVLIASPSDLMEERQTATDAINEWNAQHAAAEGIILLPEKFETHAIPQAGVRPHKQSMNSWSADVTS